MEDSYGKVTTSFDISANPPGREGSWRTGPRAIDAGRHDTHSRGHRGMKNYTGRIDTTHERKTAGAPIELAVELARRGGRGELAEGELGGLY